MTSTESQQQQPPDNNKKRKIEDNDEITTEKVDKLKREEFHTEHGSDNIGFPIRNLPSSKDTGVDDSLFRLAAQASGQIYAANTQQDFTFSENENATVLQLDTHDNLREAFPDLVVVISGSSLILAWQGSSNLTDVISDASYSPVCSGRWAHHISNQIRVHGGFYALIENDLSTHQDVILKALKEHSITQLILTGHSLGGGMAQVAQVAIEAELQNVKSPWHPYRDSLQTKTVSFSGPMCILELTDPNDTRGHEFLKRIDENSCTIVYACDVVPRVPGYLGFVDSVVYDLIPQSVSWIRSETNFVLGTVVNLLRLGKLLSDGYENLKESQQNLFQILLQFRHYGKIIHYDNDASLPVVYKDYGPNDDNPTLATTAQETTTNNGIMIPRRFRSLKWEDTPDVIGKATHDHLMTVRGPGLASSIPESIVAAKLSYMDNVSILKNQNDVKSVAVENWQDCWQKAKQEFVSASMGGVVVWDEEPKDMDFRQRKGILWIKKDLPKLSNDADLEKGNGGLFFNRKPNRTTLWRTPALDDML